MQYRTLRHTTAWYIISQYGIVYYSTLQYIPYTGVCCSTESYVVVLCRVDTQRIQQAIPYTSCRHVPHCSIPQICCYCQLPCFQVLRFRSEGSDLKRKQEMTQAVLNPALFFRKGSPTQMEDLEEGKGNSRVTTSLETRYAHTHTLPDSIVQSSLVQCSTVQYQ